MVLATRRPTPADRLAYAVSAIDGRTLSAQGLRDAGDLAMAVPSMTVTNLGAGRDKIMLRGLSDGPLTGRTQSMVGLYLDDTRLTYNAPDPDLLLVRVLANSQHRFIERKKSPAMATQSPRRSDHKPQILNRVPERSVFFPFRQDILRRHSHFSCLCPPSPRRLDEAQLPETHVLDGARRRSDIVGILRRNKNDSDIFCVHRKACNGVLEIPFA